MTEDPETRAKEVCSSTILRPVQLNEYGCSTLDHEDVSYPGKLDDHYTLSGHDQSFCA